MTYRNLFPWLIFVTCLLVSKFIIYLPLINAVTTVAFAIAVSDLIVWLVAPYCHESFRKFITGHITYLGASPDQHTRSDYNYHAAIGGVLWFLLSVSIITVRLFI